MMPEQTKPRQTVDTVRVLAWPASAQRNSHMDLLYGSMEPLGVRVDAFSVQEMMAGRLDLAPYDLWHIHWPDHHFNTRSPLKVMKGNADVLGWLKEAKAKNVKLVWTVHNLHPHERYHPYLEGFFYRPFVNLLDGWIALSQTAADEAKARFPHLETLPSFVIPRGHYRDSHEVNVSRQAAREHLGLPQDAKVILNFGQIRKYKNVPHLVRTFLELNDKNSALLVAGTPRTPRLERKIRDAAQGDPRVRLHLEFIPDDDLQYYFAAADLMVLPYKDILHSGSALMALSLDTPVLVPNLGSMEELGARTGAAWVRLYEGDLSADDLRKALAWAQEVAGQRANLDALEWAQVGKETREAFLRVLGREVGREAYAVSGQSV